MLSAVDFQKAGGGYSLVLAQKEDNLRAPLLPLNFILKKEKEEVPVLVLPCQFAVSRD